jgi:predicted metallopeptidase
MEARGMNKPARISPVMRWTSEALSQPRARGVVPITLAADSGLFRSPRGLGQEGPFHFTYRMTLLCEDICRRTPSFAHIDPSRVLVTFIRCRSTRSWGLQARLVPLRFRSGHLCEVRHGAEYRVQQIFVGDEEMKYVLSFYLPRFMNQTFDEKLITVFHELYHISPLFNGDIRRFAGPDPIHGGNQAAYDQRMADLARAYIKTKPSRHVFEFLKHSFEELERLGGEVVGLQIPTPKLLPVRRFPSTS